MRIKAVNCMVDWLEFSVFGVTEPQVMYALGIDSLFYEVKRGFYYARALNFENMIVVSSEFKGNGAREHIHVKFTGKGCRFMETLYGTTDLRAELSYRLLLMDIKVSRMDIAVDYDKKFVIDYFEAILNERVKGVKVIEHVGSLKSGLTLYLGSRKSEKFFRLYEKDFEQNDFVNYKDRVELVLKNEYATFELHNENSLIEIISTYMMDIAWKDENRQELWADMQNGRCEVSPKIRNKKSTLREKGDYILSTYSKTLKAYAEQFGTKEITAAIMESVLSAKEIRLIENEKVIKLMKYRKQAKTRIKEEQKIVDEFKYHKGVWMDRPVYENGEIVRYERQFVEQIEPEGDKFKQLNIV